MAMITFGGFIWCVILVAWLLGMCALLVLAACSLVCVMVIVDGCFLVAFCAWDLG